MEGASEILKVLEATKEFQTDMLPGNQAVIDYERKRAGRYGGAQALCSIGGLVVIAAGIKLSMLEAESANSLLAAVANGIGWYCIGRGIFMIAASFQARQLTD